MVDPTVDAAFTSYVRHEEALREQLAKVARDGGSLRDWKRVFFLDKKLRPTRQGVIRLDLANFELREGWFWQRDFADVSASLVDDNRRWVDHYVEELEWAPYVEWSGVDAVQKHDVASSTVGEAIEAMLSRYAMWGDDSAGFTALRVLLEEHADEPCAVVLMSPGMATPRRRRRSLADGRIKNLFQGQNPRSGTITYVGDRRVREEDEVTIQIHRLDLTVDDGTDEGREVILEDVPVLAIAVPQYLQERVIVERA